MSNELLLEVKDLHAGYGRAEVLHGLNLKAPAGSVITVIGPNGAGKSTLFNLVAGNITPDSGKIIFDGQDVTGLKPHQLFHRGMLRTFQIAHEFSNMTALENVVLPAMIAGSKRRAAESRARDLLDLLGLGDKAEALQAIDCARSLISSNHQFGDLLTWQRRLDPGYAPADELAELYELLGGEALHSAEFAAGQLAEVVADKLHLGVGLVEVGATEEPAVERIGEFVDADVLAGEIVGGVDAGGAERHEAGGGFLEDGAEGFEIGAGGAFLEEDIALAGGEAANLGLRIEQRGRFLAVGEGDESDVEAGIAVVATVNRHVDAGELGAGKPVGVERDRRECGRGGGVKRERGEESGEEASKHGECGNGVRLQRPVAA